MRIGSFVCLALALLGCPGCMTFVAQKPTYNVLRQAGSYFVYSTDGNVGVRMCRDVGSFKPSPHTSDASFFNHEYALGVSYFVRSSVDLRGGTGTGVRLMEPDEIRQIRGLNGGVKVFISQRLERIGDWDVLWYEYQIPPDGDLSCMSVIDCVAMRRIGNYVVHVTQGFAQIGAPDAALPALLKSMLAEFHVTTRRVKTKG